MNTALIGQIPGNGMGLGNEPMVGSNNWVISGEHTESGMPLWLSGQTHPMLFGRDAVEAAASDHLILQP